MMDNNENQCEICELYNVFQQMIADGIKPAQAFHTIIEEVERDASRDGFVSALINVYENVGNHIDQIIKPCDCEECTCSEKDEKFN